MTIGAPGYSSPRVLPLSAILVSSLLLKLALAWITRDTLSYFDEWGYYEAAQLTLTDPRFNEIFRPPGYICFLAAIFKIFGVSLFAAKAAQCVLSTLSVILLFKIATRIFGRITGLVAAGIFAFYPTLVAYTHYLWSETLFVFLLLAFLLFLYTLSDAFSLPRIFFCGVILAAASLIRSDTAVIAIVGIVYIASIAGTLRRSVVSLTLLAAGAAVIISPWTFRNYILTQRFLPVSTEPGRHLRHSFNTMIYYGHDYRVNELFYEPGLYEEGDRIFPVVRLAGRPLRPASTAPNPVDAYSEEKANALRFILDNPLLCVKRMWPKFCILWGPNSFVIRHLRLGIYGKNFATGQWAVREYPAPSEQLVRTVTLLIVLPFTLVVSTGLAGMVFHRCTRESFLLLLFIILSTVQMSFVAGMTRYRIPMMPLVIIFSSYAICHAREIIRAPDKKVRWAVFAFLFVLFLFICAVHFPILFDIF